VVHLLYCVEYERCFYRRSDDDGVDVLAARGDHRGLREDSGRSTTGR
jgi:hypothetical protein